MWQQMTGVVHLQAKNAVKPPEAGKKQGGILPQGL